MRILSTSRFPAVFATLIAGSLWLSPMPAAADPFLLAPFTKLRLSVTQWDAAQAEFRRADAMNGELVVADDGTLSVPLIGRMKVDGMNVEQLAKAIGEGLKMKIGLLDTPDASIDIVSYPPIYVVGDVANPGEYQFRPAMSILQALALSGGFFRQPVSERPGGQVELVGTQLELESEMLRVRGRIARLQAEFADARDIDFPAELRESSDRNLASEIMAQEKLIFASRANGFRRQTENFSELHTLLDSEIDVLGQKSASLGEQAKLSESEFAGVKTLVDRGVATVARRSELQRALADLKSDQLDQMTAMMRARQTLSSTMRDAAGLEDQRKVQIASDLREAQAALEKLTIRQDVVRRQLVLSGPPEAMQKKTFERVPEFQVVRQEGGTERTVTGSEATKLMPGDVVKVSLGYRSSLLSRGDDSEPAQLAGR